ncbi:hypothetical protein GCM10027048_12910 [Hymenobacter coalescens]
MGWFLLLFAWLAAPVARAQTTVLSHDFEGGLGSFVSVNSTYTNKWQVGTAAANGPSAAGSRAAYVSNDNGNSHAYALTSSAVVHLYRDVTLPAGETTINLGFDWRAAGTAGLDELLVYVAPTTYTPSAGSVPSGTNVVKLAQLSGRAGFGRHFLTLPASLAGSNRRLLFTWRNDGAGGSQPPAAIDNVVLTTATPAATALSGAYSINNTQPTAASNFASFSAAVAALNSRGVSGPVTLTAAAGQTFDEQITLGAITGSSSTNTVTFEGSGSTLRYAENDYNLPAVITLNGTDYVTFNNLSIDAAGVNYGWGVHLLGGADNNQITNCTITAPTSGSTCGGIVAASAVNSPTSAGSNPANFLNVRGCTITGGYYGICLNGTGSTALAGGHQLSGNQLRDFYHQGIFLQYTDGAQIIGNTISRPTRVNPTTFYGVLVQYTSRNLVIERNRIHSPFGNDPSNSGSAYGIYLSSVDGTAAAPNFVVNNLIYQFNGRGSQRGINSSSSSYTRFYHNTISLDDQAALTTSQTIGLYAYSNQYEEIKNNLISVTRSTDPNASTDHYALYLYVYTGLSSDYNNLHIGSGASYYTGYNAYSGGQKKTLAQWQTNPSQPTDQNSRQVAPGFANPGAGNYAPTAALLNNLATPLARVTQDITGAARSATPDMGAYEFSPAAFDAELVSLDGPVAPFAAGAQGVPVTVRNNGTSTLTSLTLSYVLNGGSAVTQTFTGLSVAPNQTAQLTLTGVTFVAGSNALAVTASQPNGQPDAFAGNDTQAGTFRPGLSGSYTINNGVAASATNFVSFTAAAAALNEGGVLSAVTFDVAAGSGPYTEQLTLNAIAGSSATHTVTFNGNGRTIQFNATDQYERHVIRLDGADYVRLNNLVITAQNSSYCWGVHLLGGADHNQITNCVISTHATSSAGAGIVASNSRTSETTTGNTASDLLLQNNTITGGYYGIMLAGQSGASATTGWQVLGNQVRDFYQHGIYLYQGSGAQVIGNDVSRPTRTSVSTFYGIYLSSTGAGCTVERNRVHNPLGGAPTNGSTVYGIYLTSATGTAAQPTDVVNNLVYGYTGTGQQDGIRGEYSAYARYYNNTVSLDQPGINTGSATYGLYLLSTATGVEVKNNVLSVTRNASGGGNRYALYLGSVSPSPAVNHNDLYVGPGGNAFTGHYNGTNYATLADWKTANGGAYDQSSTAANPAFVNAPSDLTPRASQLNNSGTPLARVTTDFAGTARNNPPDMGALEFSPSGDDAEVVSIDAPVVPFAAGAQNALVTVRNNGATTIGALTLSYQLNGAAAVSQSYSGLALAPNTSTQLTLTGVPFAIGANSLIVTSSLPNGVADVNTTNDSQTKALQTALSGSYIINNGAAASATNFVSFTAATTALNNGGVLGAVTFDVAASSGPYTEQVSLNAIVGGSATHTVTFNGNGRTLRMPTTMDNAQYAAFQLNGADYVTLDNLVIDATPPTNNTSAWGVHLTGGADYNRITNCVINAHPTSGGGAGIVASGSNSGITTAANAANDLLLQNNTVNGGSYGIALNGASTSTPATGWQVLGNQVRNVYHQGIYLGQTTGAQVVGNTVSNPTRTSVTTFYGIHLYNSNGGNALRSNRVHTPFAGRTNDGNQAMGIHLSSATGTTAQPNLVANNLVYNFSGTGAHYGIYGYYSAYASYYHNTIAFTNAAVNTGSETYGVQLSGTTTGADVKNNVVVVTRNASGGGNKYALYYSPSGTITSNHNDLYVGSGNGFFTGYYNGAFASLNNWKAANSAAWDQASVSADPLFADAAAGNFTPTAAGPDNVGTPLASVPTDILGAARSATTPDMGAYEFVGPGCGSVSNLAAINQTGTAVDISFTGIATATDYTLTYTPQGGTATTRTVTASPVALTGLTPGTAYTVSIITNCTGGQTSPAATFGFTTPPLNDDCAGAISLTVGQSCVPTLASNVGATLSAGVVAPCYGGVNNPDVWYKATVPGNGVLEVAVATISGSPATSVYFDVFAGSGCGSLSRIGCGHSSAAVRLTGRTPGEVLYIRPYTISGNNAPGAFNICASTDPCVAPTNLGISSVTYESATLSFTPGAQVTDYTVTYTPSGGTAVTLTPNATGSPVQLTGLQPSTSYTVRVTSNCGGGLTSTTASTSFTTSQLPCTAATNLAATNVTAYAADITFTPGSAAGSYTVSYGPQGGSTQTTTVNGSPLSLSNLMPSTTYNVTLISNCSGGRTATSATYSFTTSAPPCNAPTALATGSITQTSVEVSFTGGTGNTGFTATATPVGGGAAVSATGAASPLTLSGLQPGTQYTLSLAATCGAGQTTVPVTSSFSTLHPPCLAPTDLAATGVTHNAASITFSASASALSYTVTYTAQGGSTATVTPNPTAAPVALSGLLPNTQYTVSIVSHCANGQTAAPATLTFTTQPLPCAAPTNLVVSAVTSASATVSFSAAASATGYTVSYTPQGGAAQTVTTSTTSVTLTGLLANKAYALNVTSTCAPGQTSTALTGSFTTPCAAPAVTLAPLGPVCQGAAAFTLTGGAPVGGSYSGPGVSGGQFSATAAGVGTHTITYTYTDGNGCTNATTRTLEVLGTPAFAASSNLVCAGQPATLTVTGAGNGASYAWSTGATTASITVNPTVQTTYSVTVTNAAGCDYPFSQTINIRPGSATPGAVSQMQPLDNTGGLSLPVAFSWAPGASAESYDLYVWPENGTRPATATVAGLTSLAYSYGGALPYGAGYHWQVVSRTPCGSTPGPVFTFRLRELPDVRVTHIVVPDTAYAGQQIELEWNVTNAGLGSTLAQQWQDAVYISQDSVFSASATLVGRRGNTTFLQPNGTYITTATFPVPYSQAGRYYVFVRADDQNQLLEANDNNNRRRAADRVLIIVPETPDFAVENFVSPPDNSVGYSDVQLRYRVFNRGTVPVTQPRYDEFFISPDTIQNIAQNTGRLALGPNAFSLGRQRVVDTLLPGGFYQRIVTVRIPHTQFGTRYFYAYTDTDNQIFEVASTNNVNRPVPVNVVLRPPADLAPLRLTAPAGALAGAPMSVTWDVRNTGLNAPVAEERFWADQFWLSPTAAFNPATAIAVGTLNVFGGDTLQPGHHYRRTVQLNIPNGLSGQYYVFGKADYASGNANGNVFEYTYEGNNLISSGVVNVGLAYADLEPAAFTAPATIDAFQSVTVNYTVRNNSTAVSAAGGTWHDVVYITTPGGTAYLNSCAELARVAHTGPLAPGQTYAGSMTFTIPRWVRPGEYDLVFAADASGQVYEFNFEGNNSARQRIEYRYSDDLRVTALSSTGTAYSGQTIGVNWQVDNQGAFRTLATQWTDAVYLSTDNVLDNADLQLTSVGRSGDLAVGAGYGASATVRLPHGLQGNFFLIARTGLEIGSSCSAHVLSDLNPSNNVRAVALPITLTPPADLVVQAVTFPTDVVAGQQVQIPFTIRNQGTGATLEGEWNDGIYLNTSPTVNGATRIGNFRRNGVLGAGQSYATLLNVTIPAYMSGNYYIFLVTDNPSGNGYTPSGIWGGNVQYGQVYEHQQELNNTAQGNLLIRVPAPADLVVTTVAVPGNKKLGETMTVHYSVKNQGSNPAVGLLKDGLFLSQDLVLDGNVDRLFGASTRNITIQPNQTITGVVKSHVQAVNPGTYKGLMATNLYDDIFEGPANQNNVTPAGNDLQIGVDELPLRTTRSFALDLDSMVFYRVTPGADKDLVLQLGSNQAFGQNEVYVAYNRVPTASDYDYIYETQVSPTQELLIPSTGPAPYYVLVKTPYVYAGLQTATLYADTLGFQVRSITANRVGQGRVTTKVQGANFNRNTRFYLTRGNDTTRLAVAELIRFRSSVEVTLRWHLDSLALGQYNVVAQNGLRRVQLTDGLTVEPKRALSVDFATITPQTVRVGTSANWTYFLKNTSNVDVPYWEFQYNVPGGSNPVVTHTPNVRKKSDFHPGAASATPRNRLLDDTSNDVLPFVARDLVPDEVIQVNLRLTPTRVGEYPVVWNQAALNEEWYSRQTLDHIARYRQAVLANPGQFPAAVASLAANQATWQDSLQRYYQRQGLLDARWIGQAARTGYTAASASVQLPGGICGTWNLKECPTPFRPDPFSGQDYPASLLGCADSIVFTYKGRGATCTSVVGSMDPNLIVGPDGLGKHKMVGVQQTLNYQVQFENDPLLASAPAQKVRITVPLSQAFEPRAFRLGDFGWGPYQFTVPANSASHTRLIDMPDSLGYDVRVLGTVDVVNRRLLWQLETIDPATGLAPTDPNKGFLLINDSTGRGQGYVNFTIEGSASAFTGDTLAARGSIVFDDNPAIVTNRWWNILDAVAPTSRVAALPATSAQPEVQLTWTAGDDPAGSGLRRYEVFASQDNGPFVSVARDLTTTSYTFTGQPSSRYDFFTLASDSTDNQEALKTAGEAFTVIDETLAIYNIVRNQCLVSDTLVSTGSGQWQHLLLNGKVVASINDQGKALGKVAVQFTIREGQPMRSDARGTEYFDRNWKLYAQNPFVGSAVKVRFYGLQTEFNNFKAANDGDANDVQAIADLRLTQYSGPNEDCLLDNNNFGPASQIRLLTPATTAGPATTSPAYFAAEVTVPDHFSEFYLNGGSAPLPVTLTRFSAVRQGRDVRLNWQTAQERNSAYFAVEAADEPQLGFREVARATARGNSSVVSNYEALDRQVPTTGGLRYYRLRQVDQDGTVTLSPVVAVALEKAPLAVRALPNPFRHDELQLTLELPEAGQAELQVTDMAGRSLLRRTLEAPAGATTLALPELARQPKGVYVLTVKVGPTVRQVKLLKE